MATKRHEKDKEFKVAATGNAGVPGYAVISLPPAMWVTRVTALEPLVGENAKISKIDEAIFVKIGRQPTSTYVYPEHIVTDITCSRICSEDARLHRLKIGLKTGKMKIPRYYPVNRTNLH